jgi:pilus assembly protein FimV
MLFLFLPYFKLNKGVIVHIFKLKHLALALCLLTLPYSVLAAGLGKLNIMSSLGEPLKADIELLSVTPEELSSITASIASNEAYENQGLEKPVSHNDIKIEIAKNSRGAPILKLKSVQPITDAFLDMLIQVDWSSGRLLREYTLLLDPPGYASDATSSSTTTAVLPKADVSVKPDTTQSLPPIKAQVTPNVKPKSVKKPESVKTQTAEEQPLPDIPPAYDDTQAYTTARGDTLSKIAKDLKPDNISLEQMLVGLFQANPEAFDGKNMNRLKVGQIIRAPSPESLQDISKQSARKEVRVQSKNWNAYKNKLAGMVEESAPMEDAASTQTSSGKVMTAEDKAKPLSTEPKDVVKLSAGEKSVSDKALQDKIVALQEESTAKENALREAQVRSHELEKQLEDMQKLLALKNDAMSKLQTEANEKAQEPAVQNAETANADVKPESEASQQGEVAKAPPAEQTQPASPAPKPVVTPPPAAPVEQPSMITNIIEGIDTATLGIAGGGLALLAGFWLFLRNKRKKNLASFEEGIMTSGGLKANTVFGNTAGGTVDTGDTSFLTDFSQSTGGGMIDAHDVDPIAEAEVYMAYGRDAQAEEILKDAIVKEPKRYELHLKLLEIYQESGNTSAFEAISGELYTTLGPTDPVWAKVAQLGIKMDPTNPLYQVEESDEADTEASDEGLDATIDTSLPDDNDEFSLADSISGFGEYSPDELNEQTVPASEEDDSEFDADFGALEFDMDTPEDAATELSSSHVLADTSDNNTAPLEQDDDVAVTNPESASSVDSFEIEESQSDVGMTDSAEIKSEPEGLTFTDSFTDEAENSLDVPTLDFPDLNTLSSDTPKLDDLVDESDKGTSIDLDSPDDVVFDSTISLASEQNDVALDTNGLDLNLTDETEVMEDIDMDLSDAANIDLSEISLELNDSSDTPVSADEIAESSEVEPEEVETKLDLVMAYLDMEDKIGAKELLDEVMKEGGENQRKRATELLAKIA